MNILQAVRGTRDLLPPETELWNHIDTTVRRVFDRYSFGEIRTPILEDTQLFARGVGEETDIVSKEMYTFTPDAESAQSLTLRPENTAGVVRAYIEHQLGETGQLQKLYYIGRRKFCSGTAAKGPLPAVLPDRRRGDWTAQRRQRVAVARCRSAGDAGHLTG